jgi:hypothetical protein
MRARTGHRLEQIRRRAGCNEEETEDQGLYTRTAVELWEDAQQEGDDPRVAEPRQRAVHGSVTVLLPSLMVVIVVPPLWFGSLLEAFMCKTFEGPADRQGVSARLTIYLRTRSYRRRAAANSKRTIGKLAAEVNARKPPGAPHVNTLRGRRGPSLAFAGMPSCGAPSGSHGSEHSNVYAASAGSDMPLTLYGRNVMRLVRFTYSNRAHD